MVFNNVFMIENEERAENNAKLENIRILFNILINQIQIMEREFKKRSFEQKVIFDFYDKIFKFVNYLQYNNEERELI